MSPPARISHRLSIEAPRQSRPPRQRFSVLWNRQEETAPTIPIWRGIPSPTVARSTIPVAIPVARAVRCFSSMKRPNARKWRGQVNRQLNLDSTTELRRASSLRILAAKRGYVSKSIHTHKACWQWLKHVFPRPLFSSQTTPGWLFRVSFEMQSDISRQRRRECAHTEFQYPTRQAERVQHTDQTAYLKLAIVFLRALSDHHQVSHLRLAAQCLRIFELKL